MCLIITLWGCFFLHIVKFYTISVKYIFFYLILILIYHQSLWSSGNSNGCLSNFLGMRDCFYMVFLFKNTGQMWMTVNTWGQNIECKLQATGLSWSRVKTVARDRKVWRELFDMLQQQQFLFNLYRGPCNRKKSRNQKFFIPSLQKGSQ